MTGHATGSSAIGAYFYVPAAAPPPDPVVPPVKPFAICVFDHVAVLTGCAAHMFATVGCFAADSALHARHAPVFDAAGIYDAHYSAIVPFALQE